MRKARLSKIEFCNWCKKPYTEGEFYKKDGRCKTCLRKYWRDRYYKKHPNARSRSNPIVYTSCKMCKKPVAECTFGKHRRSCIDCRNKKKKDEFHAKNPNARYIIKTVFGDKKKCAKCESLKTFDNYRIVQRNGKLSPLCNVCLVKKIYEHKRKISVVGKYLFNVTFDYMDEKKEISDEEAKIIIKKLNEGVPRNTTPSPEETVELGKEMIKWVKENNPTHLSEWFSLEKGITWNEWNTMVTAKEFVPFYEIALNMVAKNIRQELIDKSLGQRFLSLYHRDLKAHEIEMARAMKDTPESDITVVTKKFVPEKTKEEKS